VLLPGWVVDLTHTLMSFLTPCPSQLVMHVPPAGRHWPSSKNGAEQSEKGKQS